MNRLTQARTSRFTETVGEARMLTTTVLANQNGRYTGANEVSHEARCYGFRPASCNTGSGERHPNSFVPRPPGLAHHSPTDYGEEILRSRRLRAGSLLLYREYDAAVVSKGSAR
jgi:hypothetical protein